AAQFPNLTDRSYPKKKKGLKAIVFRIPMVALAEQEGVTGAVGDVRNANTAVDPEDAVPRRRTARSKRPRAGVAAITAHPIETVGPRGGLRCCEFHHGFRERI